MLFFIVLIKFSFIFYTFVSIMKCKVKCSTCGNIFAAETQKYGKNKFRCPYCGAILECSFDKPAPFYTTAREVVPLVNITKIESQKENIPEVKSKLLAIASKDLSQTKQDKSIYISKQISNTSSQASLIIKDAAKTTSKIVARSSFFLIKIQEKYKNGDLWIFFIFSFIFIILTIAFLLIFAELTNFLAKGHSWIFKHYIELRNMI
ncbi:hypothetical protein HMPREF9018_0798 [Prevotella amnii CRIS 21A-A]|uniref:Uncharacterized protein n=2 Tax=Prevotella amnii TaxID=419005 RepID=E1GVJ4_9BACT|nr:hypothetical protein HMPREF9018_0798 [Prevotella amnii CRIS 21A-A]